MRKVKSFIQEVEVILLLMYRKIGMDKPANHEEILGFVADDVQETADPVNWSDSDVAIAFRRWIENQNTPEVIRKIDWSDLRGQKTVLLKLVDEIEKMKSKTVVISMPREVVDVLDGIISLIDAIQDYAVDVMKIPEMQVFDFEEEEKRENADKPNWKFLCACCNSDNVTNIKSPNSANVRKGFCKDCNAERFVYEADMKPTAKVEGFQVVGNPEGDHEGDIHPNMASSFCLYNLSQARKMIGSSKSWQILTCWTGDVEEPTLMFKGDPRK